MLLMGLLTPQIFNSIKFGMYAQLGSLYLYSLGGLTVARLGPLLL